MTFTYNCYIFYQSIYWWKNNIYMEDLRMHLKITNTIYIIILRCKCNLKCRTWICYNFISLLYYLYFISLLLNKQVQGKNVPWRLTLKLSGKAKKLKKKYEISTTEKGLFGNNQNSPKKIIKKSLSLPFECLPSHKNFRKNYIILQILWIFHIFTFLDPNVSILEENIIFSWKFLFTL